MRRPLVFICGLYMLVLTVLHLLGRTVWSLEPEIRIAVPEEKIELSGTLDTVGLNAGGHYSCELSACSFEWNGVEKKAGRVLAYLEEEPSAGLGSTIRLGGTLKAFEAPWNPGQFDTAAYYHARGMLYYIEAEEIRGADERDCCRLRESLRQLKRRLRGALYSLYPAEDAGILTALVLGEKNGIPEEEKMLYEAAGISHLLAVSGFHVSLLMGLAERFWGFFLSLLPWGRLRGFWGRRGFALSRALCTLPFLWAYVQLMGDSVSVRRAGCMYLLRTLALALGKSYDSLSALALSALVTLIPHPALLFQSSFALSYSCSFLLSALYPRFLEKMEVKTAAGRAVLLPAVIQLGSVPISLSFYYTWHLYVLPANLLVLPLATLLLLGGWVSAAVGLFSRLPGLILAGSVHTSLLFIRLLCRLIRILPGHTLILGQPKLPRILVYYGCAAAGCILFSRLCGRKMSAARELERAGRTGAALFFAELKNGLAGLWLFIFCLILCFLPIRRDRLSVTNLYVGQGDSCLISVEGRCYLLDGGRSYLSPGEKFLLPYLKQQGIRRLEYVIVSHPDQDHINALAEVLLLDGLKVGGVVVPELFREDKRLAALEAAAGRKGIPLSYVKAGDYWSSGDTDFSVLLPFSEESSSGNDASLVLLMEHPGFTALFPGDLEEQGELRLLRMYGERLRNLSYLKVAHHGSKTSSTEAFLAVTRPVLAVISCGENNVYGHPYPAVEERLKHFSKQLLRTDVSGAVTVRIDRKGRPAVEVFRPAS